METKNKDLEYYRKNAEEDYLTTPISVLRYISEMEEALRQPPVISSVCDIHKGTRCDKSFPSYTDGKCRECGGQAN